MASVGYAETVSCCKAKAGWSEVQLKGNHLYSDSCKVTTASCELNFWPQKKRMRKCSGLVCAFLVLSEVLVGDRSRCAIKAHVRHAHVLLAALPGSSAAAVMAEHKVHPQNTPAAEGTTKARRRNSSVFMHLLPNGSKSHLLLKERR